MKPFPLEVPRVLRPYILEFWWDAAKLHALDLPVGELPLEELAGHLELPFWADGGRPFQVSPRQVAADPARYDEQYARTLAADLRYPIDVARRLDGRFTVLDGVHRLLHAELAGRAVVAVRVLPWERVGEIAV
ncbi:ParB N-terminal domain-containing protein [Kribbella sandramycini]|uniref:ParB N-terminal domain-containing protein n=1 Tax=Kribbella sandramycini TaxID=60450 RepID=A0A7Y4KZ64_9ACTN|nr:ParB N-terminal domain-containing protein [Kribbella sandramycini]MBB6565098.1 hypothetical protein [Kribbella sandramycini]NOL41369.1 ParB N-terminal domain-containing protein [Kribbella sandramycini]